MKYMKQICVIVLLIVSISIENTQQSNPYKVLDVKAYDSFKTIKEKFEQIKYQYKSNKDKHGAKEKFLKAREAFDTIKKKRGLTDKDNDDNVVIKLVAEVVGYILLLYIVTRLQLLWMSGLAFAIMFLSYFSIWSYIFFLVCDMFFDEYFDDDGYIKILVCIFFPSVFLGMIEGLFGKKVVRFITCKKKKEKKNKKEKESKTKKEEDKEKTEDIDGKVNEQANDAAMDEPKNPNKEEKTDKKEEKSDSESGSGSDSDSSDSEDNKDKKINDSKETKPKDSNENSDKQNQNQEEPKKLKED